MSALSYFLEREGIATTGISLVRENTASMQPPRALWVPFPLGRPLGVPGDAAFQHAVIESALSLLQRSEGPVLEDYPIDAPPIDAPEPVACPVSFAHPVEDGVSWAARLVRELQQLQPWYALSLRRRRGRTLFGISDQSPERVFESLGEILDAGGFPEDITKLKRIVEDAKAYAIEAMTAQPGDYDSREVETQFWQASELGAAILALAERFQAHDSHQMKLVARMLAPREAVGAATGPASN